MLTKLVTMDRRIVFILVAFAVIIPMLFPVSLPVSISEPTKNLHDFIDELPAESTIMLVFDYGPSSLAELNPMAKVVMKQCFAKDVKVVGLTLYTVGTTMGSTVMEEIATEYNVENEDEIVYGEDYVYLGFRPGIELVILGMGTEIASIYETDYYNRPIGEIPMMENIKNYDQIDLVVDLSSGNLTEAWITFANGYFNQQIAAGVTGVIISQMYPYLQTGQLIGLISGIAGAAEYEHLINTPDKGLLWINVESFVHLLIVLLVIIGNIAFFVQRNQEE